MSGLRREILWEPGYDRRAEDADKPQGKRRGVHGMDVRWFLHGDLGSVVFTFCTMWLPTWATEGTFGLRVDNGSDPVHHPSGSDFGHHWDTPTYEGESGQDDCIFRPGGCFYDGSGLGGEDLLGLLLTEGHEPVWARMAEEYEVLAGLAEGIQGEQA
jgi:hypothetical protein